VIFGRDQDGFHGGPASVAAVVIVSHIIPVIRTGATA
jgi:hypothetical protein